MTTMLTTATGSSVAAADRSDDTWSQARSRRSRIWLALIALPAAVVMGVGWKVADWRSGLATAGQGEHHLVQPQSFTVLLKEKGELKAARSTEIICEVEGRSTIISLVPEGTAVQKGDLLVELASDQIVDRIGQEELKEANALTAYEAAKTELEIQREKNASDIRKAELEIELKRLEHDKYLKGEWQQALKDADIAIEQAEMNLKRRKEDFEASVKLKERDFITKVDYQNAEFEYKKAQWELVKAQMAKEVLVNFTHVAALRQRESDLQEAIKEAERVKKNAEAEEAKKLGALEGKGKELALIRDQLAKLRLQHERCRITAPTQGFVVYYTEGGRWMRDDTQIREGASVYERQVLMQLPDTSQMQVVVRVHEAKTNQLSLGQRARVRVEGIPDQVFTGTVSKIAVVADSQNRWLNPDLKEYETIIALDPPPSDAPPLKPGVTAHAEILVKKVEERLAVPVQSVYTRAGRRYVFHTRGRDVAPLEIRLGAVGTEWAEITDGLEGGEEILLAFSDEHMRLIPDVPDVGGPMPWADPKGLEAPALPRKTRGAAQESTARTQRAGQRRPSKSPSSASQGSDASAAGSATPTAPSSP